MQRFLFSYAVCSFKRMNKLLNFEISYEISLRIVNLKIQYSVFQFRFQSDSAYFDRHHYVSGSRFLHDNHVMRE